jgi:hypothetical protein
MRDPSDVLQAYLEQIGLNVVRHKKWSLIDGKLPGMRVFMSPSERHSDISHFVADVTLNKRQTIHEEFSALGDSNEGLTDGFRSFTQILLPVCLSALCGITSESVSMWETELGGRKWTLHIGNLVGRALTEVTPPIIDHDFIDEVLQALSKRNLTPDIHWVSWFYGGEPGARKTTAMLDNEPWSALAARINAVPWPAGEAYYSYRNFAILMPR